MKITLKEFVIATNGRKLLFCGAYSGKRSLIDCPIHFRNIYRYIDIFKRNCTFKNGYYHHGDVPFNLCNCVIFKEGDFYRIVHAYTTNIYKEEV